MDIKVKNPAVKGRKWRNMVTKQLERLRRIEACLKHCDKIHLKELARLLEVSEMTVRRDLNSNASHSFPLEYYGGYIRRGAPIVNDERQTRSQPLFDSPPNIDQTPEIEILPQQHARVNSYISSTVSDFIEMNDVVFFDNGELVPDIIGSIPDHIEFTGVTASLSSFIALKNKKNCNAVLQGGNYQAENDLFISPCNNTLLPMIFQKTFISVSGIHDKFGATVSDSQVFNIAQTALERSLKKYVIAEKRSHERVTTYKIGDLGEFHYLISDQDLPHRLEAACQEVSVQVIAQYIK